MQSSGELYPAIKLKYLSITNLTWIFPKLLHFGELYWKNFDPPRILDPHIEVPPQYFLGWSPAHFANPKIGDLPERWGAGSMFWPQKRLERTPFLPYKCSTYLFIISSIFNTDMLSKKYEYAYRTFFTRNHCLKSASHSSV